MRAWQEVYAINAIGWNSRDR